MHMKLRTDFIALIESYLIFKKLNKIERNRIGKIFHSIDKDHSGQIDLPELQNFISENIEDLEEHEAMEIAQKLDKDQSGKIDFN